MKYKMKKTLSWLLSLALVLGLFPAVGGTALAAGEVTEVEVADWAALVANAEIVQVTESGDTVTITLKGCVQTTGTLQVPSGKAYTLDLNGFGVRYAGSGYASVINVTDGANLTLTDSVPSRATYYVTLDGNGRGTAVSTTESADAVAVTGGYITGGDRWDADEDYWKNINGGGVFVYNNSTFTMYGGTVVGNRAGYGGGVACYNRDKSSTFNLYGGTICHNRAFNGGGGAGVVNWNTFNMYGGTICDNRAPFGGGVYDNGVFNLFDGTIRNNSATVSLGGGVDVFVGSVFNMSGGAIKDNMSERDGGGVSFHIDTDGVYSNSSTISGGEISGNTAKQHGGGVYIRHKGCTLTLTGGKITGNASANGGGVYVDNTRELKVSGSPIISGNKETGGNTDSNLSLNDGKIISVTGPLSNDAALGVTAESGTDPVEIAVGGDGYTVTAADAGKFSLDNSSNSFYQDGGGQLWLHDPNSSSSYIVGFNANGGSAVESQVIANGNTATRPADPTREGYSFNQWYADSGLASAFDFTAVITKDTTVYAGWTGNPYTVSFDANGGEGTMNQQSFTYGTAQALAGNTFTRSDYRFAGWNTQANGSGTGYADHQSVSNLTTTQNGTVTLYAQWTTAPAYVPSVEEEEEEEPTRPFTDVTNHNAWYYNAVYYGFDQGYFVGVSTTAFAPSSVMNRAMAATVLYHLAGRPEVTASDSFPDVAAGKWYTNAIVWGVAQGVITGYPGGAFGTTDPVTREQMAVLLWNCAGKPQAAADLSRFADADEISRYARDAVNWAVSVGIINGRSGGRLAPKASATRAEVAQIVMQYDLLGE